MDTRRLTDIASALGSETRARIVCALMAGTAHTGRELAGHTGVAPSTLSEHLARLLEVDLVTVETRGRHRYYRLAGPEVAALVETMMAAPFVVSPIATPRVPAGLAFARSCYDHLAGELGVRLWDRLIDLDAVRMSDGAANLTRSGRLLLAEAGIELPQSSGHRQRAQVRACLDWSQRRHHLAGAVGAALLSSLLERQWFSRRPTRHRELRLTGAGQTGFRNHFGVDLA
jgi:DNA-binding transcriptional ArsR family regulator